MDCDFRGKTAIVTGAAHGIGRAICTKLGRRGARIFAADIRPRELAETQRHVEASPGQVHKPIEQVTDEDWDRIVTGQTISIDGGKTMI